MIGVVTKSQVKGESGNCGGCQEENLGIWFRAGTKVVSRVPCREQCKTPRVSGKAAGVAELRQQEIKTEGLLVAGMCRALPACSRVKILFWVSGRQSCEGNRI